MNFMLRSGAAGAVAAFTLLLTGCVPANERDDAFFGTGTGTGTGTGSAHVDTSELAGTVNGAGASSQESAMEAWRAGFATDYPDVTVNYDPVGSGGGRTQFLDGATSFGGSDALMDAEEYGLAVDRCGGDAGAIHLPLYISPIAVIFNLPGIDSVNMTADVIAAIFDGKIITWNDAALVDINPEIALPNTSITMVHRADEAGTTENFTDYLAEASTAWPYEASGDWPNDLGESGPGTSAVVQIVQDTEGAIGYSDASRAGSLGTVALGVGAEWVPFSTAAAAAVVDASPLAESANGANDLAYKLDRTITASGTYPLVLVSYHVLCQQYDEPNERALVTSFLKYIASDAGQQQAGLAAGSSPISAGLSADITAILDKVAAN